MKQIDFLNEKSVIIEPRKGKAESDIEGTVFLFFLPTDLKIAFSILRDKQKKRRIDFIELYEVNQDGKRFAIAGPAMGAPIAVILMERLIALGAKNIIGVGSCGSLQENIHIGDYIIPTTAVVEEGTSQHYPIDDPPPKASEKIIAFLKSCCHAKGLTFTMGKIWTTDAPFRETVKKVFEYKSQNVLGVEMEMSALLTVGTFRGINAGGFLVVSDELSTFKWKSGFSGDKYISAMKTACETLLLNPKMIQ
ncbi:MAG: nucleoside phosphorylase [Thermodesulfobacteriota bacterium]|nr:nucleoside phosphorylase [Thermodesulfobacteriota bacterium]